MNKNSQEEWQEMLNIAVFTGIQNVLKKQKKLEMEKDIYIIRELLKNYHYLVYFVEKTIYQKDIVDADYMEHHISVLLKSLKIDIDLTIFYIDRLNFAIQLLKKKCEFDFSQEDYKIFHTYYLDEKNLKHKITYSELALMFGFDTRTISRKLNYSVNFVSNCFFGKMMNSLLEE